MTLVVDASVAVKWFLPEIDSDQALALLASDAVFHAPELLRLEIANALWKNVLKKTARREVYAVAALELERVIGHWHDPAPFVAAAFGQACDHSHPIHDFIYLEVARSLGTQLVTADTRLLRVAPKGLAVALADWK